MELQSHYGADTGRPRSRMPYRTSVLNFFLSDPRARSAASRPCLLQFSPPRPRINSEPSHLQEDFKPPLEVNLFLSQPFRRLERIRKLREGQERLDVPVPPALPPLILSGEDCGLIVGRGGEKGRIGWWGWEEKLGGEEKCEEVKKKMKRGRSLRGGS